MRDDDRGAVTVNAEGGHGAEQVLLGFARALRAAGVAVTHDRATAFLHATSLLGAGSGVAAYRAGRATLCGGPDDLTRFDQVFAAWFGATAVGLPLPRAGTGTGDGAAASTTVPARTGAATEPSTAVLPSGRDAAPAHPGTAHPGTSRTPGVVPVLADDREILRRRDIAGLTAAERRVLAAQLAALRPRPPLRRAARAVPWRRGRPDLHRTLRASLRRAGEPVRVERRRRARVPRRAVLLVDVSGSMRPYAEALLRLAHAVVRSAPPSRAEVFTLGTRLTRVTDALRAADPERALARAGELVPDWAGGTRLAEALAALTDRHGARLRGAVVVICSDGWERGDPAELAARAARLRRLARAVIWVNPHRGKAGYRPVQSGIAAVLPHVDHFLAGHSLATFEEALEVLAHA
ncbi:vWA domain-containing protein [Myceligenerans salitolerans]|uniref:VWA domain-containing protein n=1 Tax=Myceligenerans salitolerans TaxID=1230528 RepID=A0ABS3I5L6_9MICO|nr:VWA domain-containing protein [Myceligenerans salitolerans]MBO0608305.1 VWA domain-containing protein [Myceligenerans salitolerans]